LDPNLNFIFDFTTFVDFLPRLVEICVSLIDPFSYIKTELNVQVYLLK